MKVNRRDFLKQSGRVGAAFVAGPSLIELLEKHGGGLKGKANPASFSVAKGGELHLLQWSSFVAAADKEVQTLMNKWASHHKGWKAVLETINSDDLQTKTSSAVAGQSGPDIIQMWYNWPWLYSSSCVDVSDVVKRLEKSQGKFYNPISVQCQVDGKWLAVPYTYVTDGYTYRTDLWSKVGYPKFVNTYGEMLSASKKLKKLHPGITPIGQSFGHDSDSQGTWYTVLWAFGGKEVEKDGKTVAINSPGTEAALHWAIEMWRDHLLDQSGFSWNSGSNNLAYAAKKIAATENGSSIYLTAVQQQHALAKVTSNAICPKGPAARTDFHLTMEHAVMKWTKDVSAAKDLIEFLMQKENYSTWVNAGGGYDSYPNGLLDNAKVWKDPKLRPFNENVKYAYWPGWPGPPSRASSEVLNAFIIPDMFAKAVRSGNVKSAISFAEQQLQATYNRPA